MLRIPTRHYHNSFMSVVFLLWAGVVYTKSLLHSLIIYWPVSLTMIFGAFVAGSTAMGGNAVAFPVLTKLLGYGGEDSRTFGLFIQSVGMTSASVYILTKRIPIVSNVLIISVPSSIAGVLIGLKYIYLEHPWKNIIFSIVLFSFACALVIMKFSKHPQHHRVVHIKTLFQFILILVCSFVGGIFSSQVGTGADVFIFILLTLSFGIDIKVGTPTSVINMAAVSIAGSTAIVLSSEQISNIYLMWMSAVPIVAIFAPLGSWFAGKVDSQILFYWLIVMIAIENISTFLILDINLDEFLFSVGLIILMGIIYYGLIKARE